MNLDPKIFHKILAKQIQQHIKRITNQDQVKFVLVIQSLFNIQNQFV